MKISNYINPLTPRRTLVAPFTKISNLFKKKKFLWASGLWVGRRKEPILGYVPKNDEKKNSVHKGLIRGVYIARHTGCDAHHVYKGTRNEAHMSPSQGSQVRFTKMSSWCATLSRLTASVEISVFPVLLPSPYLDILTEHYHFQSCLWNIKFNDY